MTEGEKQARLNARAELRAARLQQMENANAKAQNRPAARIVGEDMAKSRHGYYNPRANEIHINRSLLVDQDPSAATKNYFHESRHAFQHDVVKHGERHTDISREVRESWAQNFQHYRHYNRQEIKNQLQNNREFRDMTPQQQLRVAQKANRTIFESYRNQAVEMDARKTSKNQMRAYRREMEQIRQEKAEVLRQVKTNRISRQLARDRQSDSSQQGEIRNANPIHMNSGNHDFPNGPIVHMGASSHGSTGHMGAGHGKGASIGALGGHGSAAGPGGSTGGHGGSSGGHGGSSGGR